MGSFQGVGGLDLDHTQRPRRRPAGSGTQLNGILRDGRGVFLWAGKPSDQFSIT
jgi:hypothetical protein